MSSHMSGLFEDRPVVLGASLRSLLARYSLAARCCTPLELLSTPSRDSRRMTKIQD